MAKKRRSSQFKDSSQIIDIEEAREKRQERRKKQQKRSQPKDSGTSTRVKRNIQKNKMRRTIIYAAVIIVFAIVVGSAVFKIVSLKMEQNELKKQQQQLAEEKTELQEELKNVKDLDYIEQEARARLRLALPGESVYVLPSSGNTDKSDQSTKETKNEN